MNDNDPFCPYCSGRHLGQCPDGPEYDAQSRQYWWPIHIAIKWGPCVVVRRTTSRERGWFNYEVVDIWPRTSDLNYPEKYSVYCKIAERR